METENWIYSDGGRAEAGFKGTAGDCTVRAICNATGKDYKEVYNDLFKLNKQNEKNPRSPRDGGTPMKTIKQYLSSLGLVWVPLMGIGTGCKVHLTASELPQGTIICRLSRHLTCVKDGIIYDTYDCSREGTRCVYGYWRMEE